MTLTADFGPAAYPPQHLNGPDVPHKEPAKPAKRPSRRPSSSGSLGINFSRLETASQRLKKLHENSTVGLLDRLLKDTEIFHIQRMQDEIFPNCQALRKLDRQDRIFREFDRIGQIQRILQPYSLPYPCILKAY